MQSSCVDCQETVTRAVVLARWQHCSPRLILPFDCAMQLIKNKMRHKSKQTDIHPSGRIIGRACLSVGPFVYSTQATNSKANRHKNQNWFDCCPRTGVTGVPVVSSKGEWSRSLDVRNLRKISNMSRVNIYEPAQAHQVHRLAGQCKNGLSADV